MILEMSVPRRGYLLNFSSTDAGLPHRAQRSGNLSMSNGRRTDTPEDLRFSRLMSGSSGLSDMPIYPGKAD
jgi:hypothetical protein